MPSIKASLGSQKTAPIQVGAGTPVRFLRIADVCSATGLPVSSVYDLMARKTFPRPIKLSARAVGWLENEITEWQQARIAERDGRAA